MALRYAGAMDRATLYLMARLRRADGAGAVGAEAIEGAAAPRRRRRLAAGWLMAGARARAAWPADGLLVLGPLG